MFGLGSSVNWIFIFIPIFLAVFGSLAVLLYATFRLLCRFRIGTFDFHMKYIQKMTCFTFVFTVYWIFAALLYFTISYADAARIFPFVFSARGTLLAVTWIWMQGICGPAREPDSEQTKYSNIAQALRAEVLPFLLAGIRGHETEERDEDEGLHDYRRSVSLTMRLFSTESSSLVVNAEHSRRKMKITIHQDLLFHHIRNLLQVDLSKIRGIREEKTKDGGRTDAFLYYTDEDPPQLLFKTISQVERAVLDEILEDYYHYLQANPDSLLPKIVGCYSIRFEAQLITFMLMKNILCTPRKLHQVFDLKGSSVNRSVNDPNKVLKDSNLQTHILLLPHHREAFLAQIQRDTEFLRSKHIMDYSLLLGVHKSFVPVPILENGDNELHNQFLEGVQAMQVEGPSFFIFGLVDVLQKWVLKKKLERFIKTHLFRKDPSGLSAQEPGAYRDRFCDAMHRYTQPVEVTARSRENSVIPVRLPKHSLGNVTIASSASSSRLSAGEAKDGSKVVLRSSICSSPSEREDYVITVKQRQAED